MEEVVRFPLSPRGSTPRGAASTFDEEDSGNIYETLTHLGVPTYFSKTQLARSQNTVFDEKFHELIDTNEKLTDEQKHRKHWLKIIRNYSKLTDFKPLARHFYKQQIPYRYNLFVLKRAFRRWKIRRQWIQLSSIINRINMRHAANDDKERMSEKRVLLSAKYLTSQSEFQPNFNFFILNAIPQKTPKQIQVQEEDEAADREEDRLCQLEFEYHLQEEEEEAERRRRRRKKKKIIRTQQLEEESYESNEQESVQDRSIDLDENDEKQNDTNNTETNQNETNQNDTNKDDKSVIIKQPESSKKFIFVLTALVAFAVGFGITLLYYIKAGEIHDANSFFYALKTGVFGSNMTEKCQLDPECRKRTEKAKKLEVENEEKEKLIKKLQKIAMSKDPETREEWIRQELKKLSGELKSIHEDQENMNEKIIKIKEKTEKR